MKKLVSVLLALAMLALPLAAFGDSADSVTLSIEQEWQKFDMGVTHGAAVYTGGLGYAWGYNYDGPIGNGNASGNVTTPYNFASNVKAVETNGHTTLYIDNNDTLWIIGQQYYGTGGNQGSLPISTTTPVQVATNVKQCSFGGMHFMFVKNDGTLWTWGQNTNGELGNGNTTQNYTPTQIMTGVAWCSAGAEHSAALKTDGTLYMWGLNDCGQVGTGNTTTPQKNPVQVLTNVAAVSISGNHSCAIKNDGSLWTWGENTYGQCGNGGTSNVTSPTQVLTGVAQVSAGDFHTGILKTNGTAWFVGSNYRGAFGNGSSTNYSTATKSFTQTAGTYVAIKCGYRTTALVTEEGELLVAGENLYGKLGLGYEGNPNGSGPFVATLTGNGVWIFNGGEPQPVYHTVTFKDWDGTVLSTQQVLDGEAAVAPANPSRPGYTFIGWSVDFSCVTSDLVVIAQYQSNVLLGDVDCDGDVDFTDISLLSSFLSGMTNLSAQGMLNADMDQNGDVNFTDISHIYRFLLGA